MSRSLTNLSSTRLAPPFPLLPDTLDCDHDLAFFAAPVMLCTLTVRPGGYHAVHLRFRRLWHAVRRPCRDRPLPQGRRPRRRPHVGDLAHQAARIHLDADPQRPLRGFLDAHRAGARFRAGARAQRRQGAEAEAAGGLFPARRLSRRARGAARAQGQGPQDRHPVERLARHAQGRGGRRRHRRRSRRGAVGRRGENVQVRGRRSMRWSPTTTNVRRAR